MARRPQPQLPVHRRTQQVYKKIVVSEDGKRLLGAVLVGDAAEYGTLLQMALNGIALPEDPEFLILPASDGKAARLGVDALPDSADLLVQQRQQGPDLRSRGRRRHHHRRPQGLHKAGATCGGCVPWSPR
jgi:nitrite reductase (NADH) large subunit